MNPSYFRIKLSQNEAVERLCKWTGKVPKESIETSYRDAVSSACKDGQWKGRAVYVYDNEGWTVFEDLSGGFTEIPAEDWLRFAGKESLVVAGYNDALIVAELIVIENDTIVRDFFEYIDDPESYRNIGALPFESEHPIKSWVGVAGFVDDDAIVFSDKGTVLIF